MRDDDDETIEDHDRGLAFDLPRLMSRRRAVGLLAGGIGTAVLAACGSSGDDSADGTAAGGTTEIPEETAGPFPGDGSNGPNILAQSGVIRSDITRSFGDASGVAKGVPATIEMTLLDVAAGGSPLAGAAVYVWHCDIDGQYSMYGQGVAGENYLRGVQESDKDGKVAFTTHLPRGLLRSLAAHPLRGLRERRRCHVRRLQAEDLAARPARRNVRARLRDGGLRAERREPQPDLARDRQRLQRRLLRPARTGVRQRRRWHRDQAQRRRVIRGHSRRRVAGRAATRAR